MKEYPLYSGEWRHVLGQVDILILQKLGQQVSPMHCSHLPKGTSTAVFTNRRENLKTQSVVLIKLNHVLGDTLDFPKS